MRIRLRLIRLNLVRLLHPGEDLEVAVALLLGVTLQTSQLGIAFLFQYLLRARSIRLILANLPVKLTHRGGTDLSQLETLV